MGVSQEKCWIIVVVVVLKHHKAKESFLLMPRFISVALLFKDS